MSHLLFVFLDGVGLAPARHSNPFNDLVLPNFELLAGGARWTSEAPGVQKDGHVFRGIDATLGVDGLPQSGTGQASLFTGANCARLAGRHFGPFPHSATRPVLAEQNLFTRLLALESAITEPAAFANAYPPRFFSYARRRDRWTVTTRCCLDAGVRIRTERDLAAGKALTADLTGSAWRERLGIDVDEIDEVEAGRRLVSMSLDHRLTLFEYFLTDKAGHSRSMQRAQAVLKSLDAFFAGVLEELDPARQTLLVTSDHGNLEDLSTKSHTRNLVPLVAFGSAAAFFSTTMDITHVTPAAVEALGGAP